MVVPFVAVVVVGLGLAVVGLAVVLEVKAAGVLVVRASA